VIIQVIYTIKTLGLKEKNITIRHVDGLIEIITVRTGRTRRKHK
jgi:hypothetical protein